MLYQREISSEILRLAEGYPIVTILGPRQSGKTTLAKMIFPHKPYVNLEAPHVRSLAINDPLGFLAQYQDGAVLDEIQNVPQLLSYLQVDVDENKAFGKYILTGSHQFELHKAVSQSLAGRTALLKLLPLTINELSGGNTNLTLDEYLFNGFFPQVYTSKLDPSTIYLNYYHTYVERDIRQLINIKDLHLFQKFVTLLAGRIGQVLNKDNLSNELGISSSTVTQWISILEASFIIFLLPPYFENFGKRLIKSPKLYFTDVGLASYLLGIENMNQLARDPIRGFLVENLVIVELMKTRANKGLDPHLYYYRDNHQNEVDVIYKSASQLIPIEIKSAQTYNSEFLKGLKYFKKIVGDRVSSQYLVYAGDYEQQVGEIQILNFKNTSKIIEAKKH